MINFIVRALQRETALFILPFLLFALLIFILFLGTRQQATFFLSFSLETTLLMLQCDDERW